MLHGKLHLFSGKKNLKDKMFISTAQHHTLTSHSSYATPNICSRTEDIDRRSKPRTRSLSLQCHDNDYTDKKHCACCTLRHRRAYGLSKCGVLPLANLKKDKTHLVSRSEL